MLKHKNHLPTKQLSPEELKKACKDYVDLLGEPTEEDLKALEDFDKGIKKANKKAGKI